MGMTGFVADQLQFESNSCMLFSSRTKITATSEPANVEDGASVLPLEAIFSADGWMSFFPVQGST